MNKIAYGWKYSNGTFFRSDKNDKYIVKEYSKEFIDSIREHRKNKDIYMTAFSYKYDEIKKNSESHIGNMFFDIDSKDINLALEDTYKIITYLVTQLCLEENEYKIFFSGCKGFHISINNESLGINYFNKWDLFYKFFAYQLSEKLNITTIDFCVYEWRRLLRIPFSIHSKTNLYKNIFTLEDIEDMSITEIMMDCQNSNEDDDYEFKVTDNKKLLKQRKSVFDEMYKKFLTNEINYDKPKSYKTSRKFFYMPSCIKNMKYIEGFRNKVIFQLAIYFRNQGWSKEETFDYIYNDIQSQNVNITKREIVNTIKSAFVNKHYDVGCKRNTKLKELILNKVTKCSDFCTVKLFSKEK